LRACGDHCVVGVISTWRHNSAIISASSTPRSSYANVVVSKSVYLTVRSSSSSVSVLMRIAVAAQTRDPTARSAPSRSANNTLERLCPSACRASDAGGEVRRGCATNTSLWAASEVHKERCTCLRHVRHSICQRLSCHKHCVHVFTVAMITIAIDSGLNDG